MHDTMIRIGTLVPSVPITEFFAFDSICRNGLPCLTAHYQPLFGALHFSREGYYLEDLAINGKHPCKPFIGHKS